MEVTTTLLKTFPLFKELTDTGLKKLAESSDLQKYSRRAIILAAGKHEPNLCFLFEGRMQGVDFTIDGREVGLYFIEPGEFCGELALFDDDPQPEHVIALTAAVVALVPAKILREVMQLHPAILSAVGQKLALRVRTMTYQRSLLGLPNITQRVCCQLWLLIRDHNKDLDENTEILNPPTHMEIAIMLNISRETVTRVFQILQTKEIVRRNGNTSLRILLPAKLGSLAKGETAL